MNKVLFSFISNEFFYADDTDEEHSFEYHPAVADLWNPIDFNQFAVDLCINPYLSKELDIFELRYNQDRCGYIFPIALLDTEEDLSKFKKLNSYIFIAFQILLQRIDKINDYELFSSNFEDNICVCVLNLKELPVYVRGIGSCMPSLRYYGYSYFYSDNKIQAVDNYKSEIFRPSTRNRINIEFDTPLLCEDTVIKELLNLYPQIDNLTHRFVILYQIIEYLMAFAIDTDISLEISNYLSSKTHNDFILNISSLNSEKKTH